MKQKIKVDKGSSTMINLGFSENENKNDFRNPILQKRKWYKQAGLGVNKGGNTTTQAANTKGRDITVNFKAINLKAQDEVGLCLEKYNPPVSTKEEADDNEGIDSVVKRLSHSEVL